MNCPKENRNYMDELLNIITEIECLKPEPEVCNVSCPPFGCPRGPCPGMNCYKGVCDACAVSNMPCFPPCPYPPRCSLPPPSCPKPCTKPVGCPPKRWLPSIERHCVSSKNCPSCPPISCSLTINPPFCSAGSCCGTSVCPKSLLGTFPIP